MFDLVKKIICFCFMVNVYILQYIFVFFYIKYFECFKFENKSVIEIIYCNGNVLVDLVVSFLRLLYRCKFFMIF